MSPAELRSYAAECGVDVLAITDHDTLRAYESIAMTGPGPQLVTGIELSTTWRKMGVHIVGLNVDPANATLREGIEVQRLNRIRRAELIADRLARRGIPDTLAAVSRTAGNDYIGRPDFARYLVAAGIVKDATEAFRKHLGPGKPGDVRHVWPDLDEVVGWINAAGGTAVIAHPAKYRLTHTKLKSLAIDFQEAGGEALEVVCGPQNGSTTAALARLANELGLYASCGSDFHSPDFGWSKPGGFPVLPAEVKPVWERWPTHCE